MNSMEPGDGPPVGGALPRRDVPLDMIRYRDRGHIPVSCKRVRSVVGASNRYKADPGACAAVEYLSGNKRAHHTPTPEGGPHYMQPKMGSTILTEVAFSRPVSKTPNLYLSSSMLLSDEDSHAHLLPQQRTLNGGATVAGDNRYRPLSTTPSPELHTTRGASDATNRSIRIRKGASSASLLSEEAEAARAPDSLLNVMRDSAAQGGFAKQRRRMEHQPDGSPSNVLTIFPERSHSTASERPYREPVQRQLAATPDPLLFSQRSNLLPLGKGPLPSVFPAIQTDAIRPKLRFELTDYHRTQDLTQSTAASSQFIAPDRQFTSSDRGLNNTTVGTTDRERRIHLSVARGARHICLEEQAIHNVEEERSRLRARTGPRL